MSFRCRLVSILVAFTAGVVVSGCEPPAIAPLTLPAGLALDQLSKEQQQLLRVTLEISDGARAETDVVLNLRDLSLSGDLTLDNVGAGGARTATLRVYGRTVVGSDGPAAVEVLLGDVTDTVDITPKGIANLDFADVAFDSCHAGLDGACSLVFDQNRNGNDNLTDLINQVDPAPQAAFAQVNPETLQFASGIRLGSFQRQVVVVENTGDHVIRIQSVRVAGGQGVGVSLFDPNAALVAPPRRVLDEEALDKDGDGLSDFAVEPGEEAFVAVSFAPVNSFLTTAIVQIVAVDDVTGVPQGVRSKVIANADGSQRPPNPAYPAPSPPAELELGAGNVPVVAFPTGELFSGAEIGTFVTGAVAASGLKKVGSTLLIEEAGQVFAMPADAAFAAVIQPKNRFTAALAGLSSDVDLAVVELEDADGNPATPPVVKGLLGRSRQAGTSAEAVEVVNDGDADQQVLVVLGRVDLEQAPVAVAGALVATENATFRLSCQTSRGPEFDDAAPIDRSSGSLDGGITVVLKGSGFFVPGPGEPSVRVTFNGQPSVGIPRISVDEDGKQLISVVIPPGATAVADLPSTVVVENPLLAAAADRGADGQAVSLPDGFRYDLPTPRLLSMTPDVATVDGGNLQIAVGGAFFSDKYGAPKVLFDDVAVDADFIDSATLNVRPPAHAAGVASVTVRSVVFGGGLGEPSGQRAFLFVQPTLPAPNLSAIAPATGDAGGGDEVVLAGSGFDNDVRVFFGSFEATIVIVTDTAITVRSPAVNDAGAVDVLVLNPDGQVALSRAAFAYLLPPPSITRVFPNRATLDGNAQVVVEGAGFRADVNVTFFVGAEVAAAILVDRKSSTSLIVTTPAILEAGVGTLVVSNGDEQQAETEFTFFEPTGPAPRLVALDPNSGSVDGGTEVTLLGSAFDEPTILVGGTQIEEVDGPTAAANGLSTLRFRMPAKAAGVQLISVFNRDGQGATTSFTYVDVGQARIVGLRPPVVHAGVPGDEILVFGEDLGLLGTPVTATADVDGRRIPLTVSFVADSFASVFVEEPLDDGSVSVTLTGPAGTVTSPVSLQARDPAVDRVFIDGTDVTIVGSGLAGERVSQINIGGVNCSVRIADERVISCRLETQVFIESQPPPVSLGYNGVAEPVVDDTYEPIVGGGDGGSIGGPKIFGISSATWPNDLVVSGDNLTPVLQFEATIAGDRVGSVVVRLAPLAAGGATSLSLPSRGLAPGNWEICLVGGSSCSSVQVGQPVQELEPNNDSFNATGIGGTFIGGGVAGLCVINDPDFFFFRPAQLGPQELVVTPSPQKSQCVDFGVEVVDIGVANAAACEPLIVSFNAQDFSQQVVIVSNFGFENVDYTIALRQPAVAAPPVTLRNVQTNLLVNTEGSAVFLSATGQSFVINDQVDITFALQNNPSLALCALGATSVGLCDPTSAGAHWVLSSSIAGPIIQPASDPNLALTHDGQGNLLLSTLGADAAAFVWAIEPVGSETAGCGNGFVEGAESCDDNNPDDADGCSSTCFIEAGFQCNGQPSVCAPGGSGFCSNGIVELLEECDDGNVFNGDGCEGNCQLICGNGSGAFRARFDVDGHCLLGFAQTRTWFDAENQCENFGGYLAVPADGAENELIRSVVNFGETWIGVNDLSLAAGIDGAAFVTVNGDPNANLFTPTEPTGDEGCVQILAGQSGSNWNDFPCNSTVQQFACELEASPCGNGVPNPGESCDDGNTFSGDGCDAGCLVEPGFICNGRQCVPSGGPVCGNGLIEFPETCDDGPPPLGGDGCSNLCQVEPGFFCNGQPSVCTPA